MKKTLFFSLIVTAVLLIPSFASADERVRCESKDGRRRRCAHETLGAITVDRQLSLAACVKGESWGYDDEVIWVDNGCRADFLVIQRREHHEDYDEHHGTKIICESTGRRQRCDVDIPYGVRLMRQLGRRDCIRGDTWGYDRDGIWVSDGCRAEFLVEGDREGRDREGDHYRGERYERDRYRTIRCESNDNRNHLCAADTRFGVELSRQLSISDCTYRSSWGYNERGIWVTDGCRAEFTIRIR
jgi:hypothetical protein